MKVPKLGLGVLPVLILIIAVFASGFTVMTYEYVELLKSYKDSARMAWVAAREALDTVSQEIEYLAWTIVEDENLTQKELYRILESIKHSITASKMSLYTLEQMLDKLGYEKEKRDIQALTMVLDNLDNKLEVLKYEYIISGRKDFRQEMHRNLDTLIGISTTIEMVLESPMKVNEDALVKLKELVRKLGE